MFSFFKRKLPLQPTVTPADKQWVEGNIDWFIRNFSLAKITTHPFLLPGDETVTAGNLTTPSNLQFILEKLCRHWGLDPNSIVLKIFDDLGSKKWNTPFVPISNYSEPQGLYEQLTADNGHACRIHIAQSNLNSAEVTITILAHELAHAKLLGGNYVSRHAADMEPLTDLACIYFGFGVFLANTCQHQQGNWLKRMGYLHNEVISYANALLCYITGYDPAPVIALLNTNTRELFLQDYQYLIATGDTLLTKAHIQETEQQFMAYKQMATGFKEKNFDLVIEACHSILGKSNNDAILYNNIGYAFIGKKQYRYGIEAFTKAIEKDPFFDYPYNNRGYCHLQLGEPEEGFTDIHSSWEMNPHNSFNWRNLGVYYWLTNDLPKALEFLEKAEKMDPNTEMINFYLGIVHQHAGNTEKARHYFEQSTATAEFNDSVFEAPKQ